MNFSPFSDAMGLYPLLGTPHSYCSRSWRGDISYGCAIEIQMLMSGPTASSSVLSTLERTCFVHVAQVVPPSEPSPNARRPPRRSYQYRLWLGCEPLTMGFTSWFWGCYQSYATGYIHDTGTHARYPSMAQIRPRAQGLEMKSALKVWTPSCCIRVPWSRRYTFFCA